VRGLRNGAQNGKSLRRNDDPTIAQCVGGSGVHVMTIARTFD
jgi:hypothetical protein